MALLSRIRASLKNKSRWTYVLTLLLAALLAYLAIRGVNWQDMLGILSHARLEYLALGCLVGTCSFFIRARRWRLLLEGEKPISTLTVFWATMAGYLGNSFLPARAGELIRSGFLARHRGVSTSFVLATALTERIIDFVVLAAIAWVAIVWFGLLPSWLLAGLSLIGVVGLSGLAVLLVLPRLGNSFRWLLDRLPIPEQWVARAMALIEQFMLGLHAIQRPGPGLAFVGLTGVIWLVDALSTVLGARGLNLTLDLTQALVLLAALGLSSAVPSAPGNLGAYQFVGVTVMQTFGLSQTQALTFVLVSQFLYYVQVTIWGLIGLWQLRRAEAQQGLQFEQVKLRG